MSFIKVNVNSKVFVTFYKDFMDNLDYNSSLFKFVNDHQ